MNQRFIILLTSALVLSVSTSQAGATSFDNDIAPSVVQTVSYTPDYDSLSYDQQKFVDTMIESLYMKMGYEIDTYYIQDIILELKQLKIKQVKLSNLIDVIIDRLEDAYLSDESIDDTQLSDELVPISNITNKKYTVSKRQFIRLFRDKAWEVLNRYPEASNQKDIASQIKNKLDYYSGSLNNDDVNDLKQYTDSLIVAPVSGTNYSMILSSLDNIYPDYDNSSITPSFVEGAIIYNNITYSISSSIVNYTGSVVLDLWSNGLFRSNNSIYFNYLSESAIKSITGNGTIVKILAKVTNNGSTSQSFVSGYPILKDSTGIQHSSQYSAPNNYGVLKSQESISIPYYVIIDKGAKIDYILYTGPFTEEDGRYIIENK